MDYNPKEFDNPDFREALLAVAGQGGVINGKRLGQVARRSREADRGRMLDRAGWHL